MSGPKYMRYTMTAEERQRLLQEQLERARLEAIKKEKQRMERLIQAEEKNVHSASSAINRQKSVSIDNINTVISNIEKELNKLIKQSEELEKIDDLSVKNLHESLTADYQKLIEKNKDNNTSMTLKQIYANHVELNKFFEKLQQEVSNATTKVSESKQKIMDNISVKIEKSIAQFAYQEYEKHLNFDSSDYVDEIINLSSNEKLSAPLKRSVLAVLERLQTIKDIKQLKDYCLGVVGQIIYECENYLSEYEHRYERFEKLYEAYEGLCMILHKQATVVEFSDEAITYLENENEKLQVEAECLLERQYIATQFNEILKEMGYNLLGQKANSINNDTFYTNRLYSYENGNVASVTFSSSGQISIEIGSVDNVSREPSKQEAMKQVKSMEKLCEDLPEIEERLAERGIMLKQRIAMQPAVPEVAQIFNGKDYNIKVEKEEYIPIEKELVMYMEDEQWL